MTEKPRKKFQTKDFQPEDKKLSEYQELKEECAEIFKTFEGKNICISSNISKDDLRKYFVEQVVQFTLNDRGGYTYCLRLVNSATPEDKQPTLRYPTEPITRKRLPDGSMRYTLTYSYDADIQRDFKHMHKNTHPDMKIYVNVLD